MNSIVSAEKGKTHNAYLILLHLKIKVKLMNFMIRRDQYDYFFFFLNENEVIYLCYTFPLKRFLRKVIAFYSFIIYRFLISNYDNIVFHCTRASGTKLGGGKKLLRQLLVLYFAIYFLFSLSGQDIPVIQKKEKNNLYCNLQKAENPTDPQVCTNTFPENIKSTENVGGN